MKEVFISICCLLMTFQVHSQIKKSELNLKDSNSLIKAINLQAKKLDSITGAINALKHSDRNIIVKTADDDSTIFQILSAVVSILAILATYFGVYKQVKSSEIAQTKVQNKEWNNQLIEYISELINEIDKHGESWRNTILKGKPISDIHAIIEIKLDLLLDENDITQKQLFKTIELYKNNTNPQEVFAINDWLKNIKNETHLVLKSKLL